MKRRSLVVLSLLCLFFVCCAAVGRMSGRPHPVATTKHGFDGAGVLYVQMRGGMYRYQRYAPGSGTLTADRLVDEFTEEMEWEGICWEVYTVKEYPDRSYLLVRSGTNSEWTFRWGDEPVSLLHAYYMDWGWMEKSLTGKTREEIHAVFGTPCITRTEPAQEIYTPYGSECCMFLTYTDTDIVEQVEWGEYTDRQFFVIQAPIGAC